MDDSENHPINYVQDQLLHLVRSFLLLKYMVAHASKHFIRFCIHPKSGKVCCISRMICLQNNVHVRTWQLDVWYSPAVDAIYVTKARSNAQQANLTLISSVGACMQNWMHWRIMLSNFDAALPLNPPLITFLRGCNDLQEFVCLSSN